MKVRKILITGGAGYIGSVLTEKLLKSGCSVVVLDNLMYSDIGIRHLKENAALELIEGDIRDQKTVSMAMKDVETVIHLAAIANDPSGALNPELTRQVNYQVYPMLLSTSKTSGVRQFFNASTFGVYGIKDGINITEDEELNPLKEYSVCKAKSEVLVREANDDNFTTVSLRCATVCGWSPRIRLDLIVNTLTALAVTNNKLMVFGGEQKRPQIHIGDLTDYFIKLIDLPKMKTGGGIFNAGGQNSTIREIALKIKEIMGDNLEIEFHSPREDERSYHVSSEKIKTELGLKPNRTISDAIEEIILAHSQGLWKNPHDSLYHNVLRMKQQNVDRKY